MICYVDDLFHIGFKPKEDMDDLNMILRLKEVYGPHDGYLGARVEKVHLEYEWVVWSTRCVDYLKSSVDNINNVLGVDKTELNNDGDGHRPYSSSFKP